LIRDKAGNLYGTTILGTMETSGTVFKLAPDGTETVLHAFLGQPVDGALPADGLIMDKRGNLYGTTQEGGPSDAGTVFKVAKNGAETILHSFGANDANFPFGGLIEDKNGNLYGTATQGGAHGLGAVFKVARDGAESLLYSFAGGSDGSSPFAGLIMDKVGNLYGTTMAGGAGFGTVFRLSPGGTETVLHSFAGRGESDGASPSCVLLRDKKGNLYGTTGLGGTQDDGTVFEITAKGGETVLHSFAGGSDGAWPPSGLIADKAGNLYGTTVEGGADGAGTVFMVTP
jgi:uncharacterized repeat protein (TIGR03803 family)